MTSDISPLRNSVSAPQGHDVSQMPPSVRHDRERQAAEQAVQQQQAGSTTLPTQYYTDHEGNQKSFEALPVDPNATFSTDMNANEPSPAYSPYMFANTQQANSTSTSSDTQSTQETPPPPPPPPPQESSNSSNTSGSSSSPSQLVDSALSALEGGSTDSGSVSTALSSLNQLASDIKTKTGQVPSELQSIISKLESAQSGSTGRTTSSSSSQQEGHHGQGHAEGQGQGNPVAEAMLDLQALKNQFSKKG